MLCLAKRVQCQETSLPMLPTNVDRCPIMCTQPVFQGPKVVAPYLAVRGPCILEDPDLILNGSSLASSSESCRTGSEVCCQ